MPRPMSRFTYPCRLRWLCCAALLLAITGCAQPAVAPAAHTAATVPVVSTDPPPLVLRGDHPQQYVVGPEDNVWDISSHFLADPWRWNELWPQGQRPPLYPGDVIRMQHGPGQKPQLELAKGERPTIKLEPQIRIETINRPIAVMPPKAMRPFIDNSVVMSDASWKGAPYVVGGADGRPLMVAGNAIFARGAEFDHSRYSIFRPDQEFHDPRSGAFLGFNLLYVGEAELEDVGDPATLRVLSSQREVLPGDRLLPAVEQQPVYDFATIPAPPDSNGQILAVLGKDPVAITRYDTVVVNLGNLDGMRQGVVLAVYHTGSPLSDPLTGGSLNLPHERAGLLVLYKVFDRVSYGLVAEARREFYIGDPVRTP